MQIDMAAVSVCGPVRARNEDHALILDQTCVDQHIAFSSTAVAQFSRQHYGQVWAAVADGVSGARAGNLASSFVVQNLRDQLVEATIGRPLDDVRVNLSSLLNHTNGALIKIAGMSERTHGMSTTLSGIFLDARGLTVFHAGDSRVYRLRSNRLEQLTNDPVIVNVPVASTMSSCG